MQNAKLRIEQKKTLALRTSHYLNNKEKIINAVEKS